jgi:hypothetical protein
LHVLGPKAPISIVILLEFGEILEKGFYSGWTEKYEQVIIFNSETGKITG